MILVIAFALIVRRTAVDPGDDVVRFAIDAPSGWNLPQANSSADLSASAVSVSPDGRRVAFVAVRDGGDSQIWLRSFDTEGATLLAGTEGGHSPFWSPDGRTIGFFSAGKLRKVDISGGPPLTLATVDGRGATWGGNGIILVNPSTPSPLLKVPVAGGAPSPATEFGKGDIDHRQPVILPDGLHFLYVVLGDNRQRVFAASLDSADRKFLLDVDSSEIAYSRGFLLFLRDTTLMAQRFDANSQTLQGDPFPVVDHVQKTGGTGGYALFSASANGVLAYRSGSDTPVSQLTWFDRTGKALGTVGEPAAYSDLALSPDGNKAAVTVTGPNLDVWVFDLKQARRSRLTFDSQRDETTAIWSPDGGRVAYTSNNGGTYTVFERASDGTGDEKVLLGITSGTPKYAFSWSPDGNSVLYQETGEAASGDIRLLSVAQHTSALFLHSPFNENRSKFSPDGRWVA